jgi:hypothetical protein
MRTRFAIACAAMLFSMLPACNQPFEPDGPVNSKLVIYSILNGASNDQYVRLSTTYAAPPGPELRNASVRMMVNGRTVVFRDTTITTTDALGNPAPINVYIAYNHPIAHGSSYQLQVSTPAGLTASVNATALQLPSFNLTNTTVLNRAGREQITLSTSFGSFTGAFVLHFYLDFYAYVDGGWELHRTEVPLSTRPDKDGNLVKVFPSLSLVQALAASQKVVSLQFDTLQYSQTRAEAMAQFAAAPVVWLQGVFVLTQIDNVLYDYYYVNNGPVDKSSVRLDQPDYTNIPGGLGVFGSSVTVTMSYPILR